MTPRALSSHGYTVTLAGDPADGCTCTITPPNAPTVAADGPTPADAMQAALEATPGSFEAVLVCVELLEEIG